MMAWATGRGAAWDNVVRYAFDFLPSIDLFGSRVVRHGVCAAAPGGPRRSTTGIPAPGATGDAGRQTRGCAGGVSERTGGESQLGGGEQRGGRRPRSDGEG